MAYHTAVMARQVLEMLNPEPGETLLDATLGGGGHALLLAQAVGVSGLVIGVDRDGNAIQEASRRLLSIPEGARPRIELIRSRFDLAIKDLVERGGGWVDGALFDLGVSSHQLDTADRGFSFKDPSAPLDMRMDQESMELTAADLLNELPEREIARVLRDFADERWALRIAKFVVERRNGAPYRTVGQLIDTVKAAMPAPARPRDMHPATRTFEALRIAVNGELDALEAGLRAVVGLLAPGARITAISYHSGEDRIVKRTFSVLAGKCICPPEQPICTCEASSPSLDLITRKPVVPESSEIAENPRARSAKMRVAERRMPHVTDT